MTGAPRDIRRFETVQIVLMSLALVSSLILDRALIDTFGISAIIGKALAIGGFIGLTLLVTRGRKNWARWALLALYILSALFAAWEFQTILSSGHPLITALSLVLRGAALVLAFTPQSTEWLQQTARPA
jgi:hypothetical protein